MGTPPKDALCPKFVRFYRGTFCATHLACDLGTKGSFFLRAHLLHPELRENTIWHLFFPTPPNALTLFKGAGIYVMHFGSFWNLGLANFYAARGYCCVALAANFMVVDGKGHVFKRRP
jgi:hypothetical protein